MPQRTINEAILLLLLLCSCGQSLAKENERKVFQVTFGTRPNLGQRSGVTDAGTFVTAAGNGDIVVAGYGASTFSDTGSYIKPMVARVNSTGKVLWRRIYDELAEHEVIAFLANGDHQYLVFEQAHPRNSDGDLAPRYRLSLRSVDRNGRLSRELGAIDGLYKAGIFAYQNSSQAGFQILGLITEGTEWPSAFGQDLALFDLRLDGTSRRLAIPEGIKGAGIPWRNANGDLYFLRMSNFFFEPIDFVRLSPGGSLQSLFRPDVELNSPAQLLATEDRLFLFEHGIWREGTVPMTAFAHDGRVLWRKPVQGLTRFNMALLLGDDLLVAGSYENNPVLLKLNSDGKLLWSRRFRSAKAEASILGMAVIENDWLALSGATGPGSGAFVSTDSDAFLAVTDSAGLGLETYGNCMADADQIESLRTELFDRAGLEVERENFMSGQMPRPVEELPPFGEPLSRTLRCEELSEHDMRQFLLDAADVARKLDLSKPSARAKIHLRLRPADKVPFPGYREFDWHEGGRVPVIEANINNAGRTIEYIANEVLPYSERMLAIMDALPAASGIRLHNAYAHYAAGVASPFSENTVVAERFLELFHALDPAEQAAIRARYDNNRLIIVADRGSLKYFGRRQIIVGSDRIDEIFDYLLRDLPELERKTAENAAWLEQVLNLTFRRRDMSLTHAEYLDVLKRIVASAEHATERERAIVHSAAADIYVSRQLTSDLQLSGRRRVIEIKPVAADLLLRYIVDVQEQLHAQEPRTN